MVTLNTDKELTPAEMDELLNECFKMVGDAELSPELQEANNFDAFMTREMAPVARSMAEFLDR